MWLLCRTKYQEGPKSGDGAAVIAALPPGQWDEQVTYTANRLGEDQPAAMVYTEVIAAAIDYDFSAEHHPPAEQGAAAVKLAARLEQRQAIINRRARDEALKTVADPIRTPAKDADQKSAEAGRRAEKRRRDEQKRRDPRHGGPRTSRGPAQR